LPSFAARAFDQLGLAPSAKECAMLVDAFGGLMPAAAAARSGQHPHLSHEQAQLLQAALSGPVKQRSHSHSRKHHKRR
jgi:hypothetical protein